MSTQFSDLIDTLGTKTLITTVLADNGYEGDITPGSPIYQLLVEPAAAIFAKQVAEQDALRNSWTLMSRTIDTSIDHDTDAIVSLFSNLRLVPGSSTSSTGPLQIVFSTNDTRQLPQSESFLSPTGITFSPDKTYTLVGSESERVLNTDAELVYTRVSGGYAVVVAVTAPVILGTAITTGGVFTTSLSGVVSSVAAGAFSSGRAEETIGDLLRLIPETLSETSMVSPVSVTAYLYQEFPEITNLRVFRAGDPEVTRAKKNALGIATPAADIVVTTTNRPSVVRAMLPGYIELSIDADNIFYNGDVELTGNIPTDTTDNIRIEAYIDSNQYNGLNYIVDAGINGSNTSAVSTNTPDTPINNDVTIRSRDLLLDDDRYGNLPVTGSDPDDFFLSSYQTRIKADFETSWQLVDNQDILLRPEVKAWVAVWEQYIVAPTETGILDGLAAEYWGTFTNVPRVLRKSIPVYMDIVYFTKLYDLQVAVNDETRRCFGQDYVVKSPNIITTEMSMTVSKDANYVVFREDYFKNKIVSYINNLGLSHYGTVSIDMIKALIFSETPRGTNEEFDLSFTYRMMLPDNTWTTVENSATLEYIPILESGITDRNTLFSCSTDGITIKYI